MGTVEKHEYQIAALFEKVLHCAILNMLTARGKEQITPYRQTLLTTRYSHKAKKDRLMQSNPSKKTTRPS